METTTLVLSMPDIMAAFKFLAAGIAAIPMGAVARSIADVWVKMIETVGRNPAAKDDVTVFGYIGAAMAEASALYALVIALLVLFS